MYKISNNNTKPKPDGWYAKSESTCERETFSADVFLMQINGLELIWFHCVISVYLVLIDF